MSTIAPDFAFLLRSCVGPLRYLAGGVHLSQERYLAQTLRRARNAAHSKRERGTLCPVPIIMMEMAVLSSEASNAARDLELVRAQKRKATAITLQILAAVLLLDLAGAGTIAGLGEAHAAQERNAGPGLAADHAPFSTGVTAK
jgi:hypothetical protein